MSTNNASTTCGYLSELINYINLPYELEAINHSYAYNWINESYVKRKEPPPPPTAVLDPDISGLGVILAFIISAYLTWATVAIGYCCGWLDERLLGDLDRRLLKIKPRSSTVWSPLLRRVVLIVSDQQIITGIAILVAGFAKRSNIMVYDWQLVTYLAWMSSGTHLITLSVLRIYLREYPQLRMWRICGMLMLFVMLFVAIMPTGSNNWYEIVYFEQPVLENVSECTSTFIPAKCFWNSKFWNAWRWEGALSYALLISNYVIRAGALFELNGQRFERWRPQVRIRAALDATVKDLAITSNKAWRRAGFPQRVRYHALMMTYCTVLAISDIHHSFAAPILWVSFSLIWGTLVIMRARRFVAEENSWGFGQIIPLLLLALPLLAMFEAFYEVKKPGSQPNTTDTNDTNGCQPNMIQLSSPEHASETSPILPSLPLEEPLSRTVLEATVHGDQSVLSSREDPAQPHSRPLIQSTQGIQAEANADEIELTGTSSKGNSDPLALLHPETGRLEAGISADGQQRRWKGFRQDFYASKWFKGLIWLILFASVCVAIAIFTSFYLEFDLFQEDGIYFWVFCIVPPVGIVVLYVPAGVFCSKIFRQV